jgi:Peptidase family M28
VQIPPSPPNLKFFMFKQVLLVIGCLMLLATVIFQTHFYPSAYPKILDTHLQAISKEIHPVGSDANKKVGDYIIANIPNNFQVSTQYFVVEGKQLRNIFAFLKGNSDSTTAISSHYDSADNSYGAGDAGLGIASMLTTVQQIKSSQDNNLLFMFMDGEEGFHLPNAAHTQDEYLYGSRYFVENYQGEFGQIETLYNFEGRGTSGRLMLFESIGFTDEQIVNANNNLESQTFSLANQLYKTQPNITDVAEYKKIPNVKILNFAIIGDGQHYHTPQDNYENVSKVSKSNMYSTIQKTLRFNHISGDNNNEKLYFSVGNSTLSISKLAVQIISIIASCFLISSFFKMKNYRLILLLPFLFLSIIIDYTYIIVITTIFVIILNSYKEIIGKFTAQIAALTIAISFCYTLLFSLISLLGFGLQSTVLVSLFLIILFWYYISFETKNL